MPDGTITAILQGVKRFRLQGILAYDPYITAKVLYLEDVVPADDNDTRVIAESLKERAATIIKASSFAPREAIGALKSIDNFVFLVNFIATTVEVENFPEKVDLLRYEDLKVRAMKLLTVLDTQIPAQDQAGNQPESEVRHRSAAAGVLPEQPAPHHPGRARYG